MTLPTIPARLSVLRKLLLETKEFRTAAEYFHDHLASDQQFLSSGDSANHPILIRTLERVLQQRFGGCGTIHASQLVHLREHQFWHGSAIWGTGGLAMLLYFNNPNLGLFTLFRSLGDATAHFTRFTIQAGPHTRAGAQEPPVQSQSRHVN